MISRDFAVESNCLFAVKERDILQRLRNKWPRDSLDCISTARTYLLTYLLTLYEAGFRRGHASEWKPSLPCNTRQLTTHNSYSYLWSIFFQQHNIFFHGDCTRPLATVPSPLPLRESVTCYHRRSRHCRHCRLSSVHWRRNCFTDRTTTHTSGNSSIDTRLIRDIYCGPEILFETCVAMTFVNYDDDNGLLYYHFLC